MTINPEFGEPYAMYVASNSNPLSFVSDGMGLWSVVRTGKPDTLRILSRISLQGHFLGLVLRDQIGLSL
jgi:hypothetical protein